MILLVLGLVLWWIAHLFPIVAQGQRARLATRLGVGPSKGVIALGVILSIVLMVIGYRQADVIDLWYPVVALRHVNNALMVLAVFVFIAGSIPSPVRRWIRHPQLTGVKIWAVAHLLVNGDLASVVLFGGLLAWAVVAVIFTNRRDGPRDDLPPVSPTGWILHVAAAVAVFAVIAALHTWFGVSPFAG